MRLPHTDSAEAIWAFKKGYRFGKQGKPLNEMPVTVRAQPWLRDYFMQGYEQAQAELTPPRGDGLTPRKRIIWLFFAALAGVGTAWLMIQQIQADKRPDSVQAVANASKEGPMAQNAIKTAPEPAKPTEEPAAEKSSSEKVGDPSSLSLQSDNAGIQARSASTNESPVVQPEKQAEGQPPQTAAALSSSETEMPAPQDTGLLDEEARAKQRIAARPTRPETLPPVVDHAIRIARSSLARTIQNREPGELLGESIPRSVRQLYFFTEVANGAGHSLHHRWYYGDTLMADITLPIGSDRYRTWSSKRMSPAWQGRWHIDVTDEKGQVIARKFFIYGQTH
ncbi:Protein of unknown function [Sulfurivirga caldicuralii]|uniref:DUF2914 domain-containing protein n=1 Tax=Sulfurivirga caldicuralii TaxID=364032 RepID=A0A1N6GXF7_9GAMM|nr:DUF2914 domain-containing protein [Sulfurivirga caldicuralii]SIO12238.1 Protein of unknown function [Sulfurivirga caldicuralii]